MVGGVCTAQDLFTSPLLYFSGWRSWLMLKDVDQEYVISSSGKYELTNCSAEWGVQKVFKWCTMKSLCEACLTVLLTCLSQLSLLSGVTPSSLIDSITFKWEVPIEETVGGVLVAKVLKCITLCWLWHGWASSTFVADLRCSEVCCSQKWCYRWWRLSWSHRDISSSEGQISQLRHNASTGHSHYHY